MKKTILVAALFVFSCQSIFSQIKVNSVGAVSIGSTTSPPAGYEMQLTGKSLFSDNVGIGTNSPIARLSINGLSGTAASSIFTTYHPTTLSSSVGSDLCIASIGYNSGNQCSFGIHAYRSTAGSGWDFSSILLGMDVDASTRVNNGYITICNNGNIGIGTTTPGAILDVGGTSSTNSSRFCQTRVGYCGQAGAAFYLDGNTGSTGYALLQHSNGNTYINTPAGGTVCFRANNTDKGYWTSTGLGINVSPSYTLDVNGTAHCNSGAWTSDQRLKTKITGISNAISIIKQLKPHSYYMDTANVYGMKFGSERQYGVLAQEVEKVLPELVSTAHKPASRDSTAQGISYKAVNYIGFIAILMQGVQEQQTTIDSLTTVVKALQTQVTRIVNTCCPVPGGHQLQNNGNSPGTNGVGTIQIELKDVNAIVLNQNVPNPFAEQTIISYNIPEILNSAQILFYDEKGMLIKTADIKSTGQGQLNVYANDLSNGIYSYTLVVDGKIIDTKRMVKQK